MKDRNLFHRVDTIGNIFTRGTSGATNILYIFVNIFFLSDVEAEKTNTWLKVSQRYTTSPFIKALAQIYCSRLQTPTPSFADVSLRLPDQLV